MSSPPFDADKYKALMSGLEIIEINFKQLDTVIDYRIESEFFLKKFINIDEKLSKRETIALNSIARVVNGRAYDSESFNSDSGVRIAKIGDVTAKTTIKQWEYVATKEFENKKGAYLLDGDILMSLTGDPPDVGKVQYLVNPINATWNQRVARITIKNEQIILSNAVLFVVLSCEYVRGQLERYAKGIRQRNLGVEAFEHVLIPKLGNELQEKIDHFATLATQMLVRSEQLYNKSNEVLMEELGLDNWQPSKEKISVRSVVEVEQAGRWDAEYYQPKYDEIKNLLRGFRRAQFSINTENYIPKPDREYVYLELGNILASGIISPDERQLGEELPTRARRLIHEGQVIVSSIEGSLESCALVTAEYDGAICSNGFFVMNSDDINPETLLVLMKSQVMQAQMKQLCSGSILAAVNVADMESLYLPAVTLECQSKIKSLVTEMYACHHSSITLLNAAKRAVEIAIEEDENAALTYLSSQTDTFTDEEYSIDVSQQSLKVAEPEVGDNTNIDKGIKADERT